MAHTLSLIAAVSGVYDTVLGVLLLTIAERMAAWFGAPAPVPPVLAELNGVILLAIGLGYWYPYRDPAGYRGYLWVMGPLLKGGGAVLLVTDVLVRHSPTSFLVFAAGDGVLALVTLWVLLATRGGRRTGVGSSGQ